MTSPEIGSAPAPAAADRHTGGAPPRRDPTAPCRNCGDTTHGNFCPTCGQRKGDPRASLRRLTIEVLDDELSLNSRLPRTLGALLFRPGFLTTEYVAGRIVRYLRPVRLYLLSSVLFFLLLTFVGMLFLDRGRAAIGGVDRAIGTLADSVLADPEIAADPARRDSALAEIEDLRQTVRRHVPQAPGWAEDLQLRTGWPLLDARLQQRLEDLSALPPDQAARMVIRDFLNRAPVVVFLLLPIFALLMKVLYLRSRRYYVEHFIFALHLHAFWFFAFTLMLLFRTPWVVGVLALWILIYVFLAMKRVYGQGLLKTALKYWILSVVYPAVVMFGVLLTVVAALTLD